jgi:hypothetical protein
MNRDEIRAELQDVFRRHLGVASATVQGLVPQTVLGGKLYEAYVLSRIVRHLAIDEGYSLTLVGGPKLQLKSSPGPINRNYPRIELRRSARCLAELWTDVEFLSLSYCTRNTVAAAMTPGDFHELDIIIVTAGVTGRPPCNSVWLGVECKNTGYEKGLLKEILGIRRELSFVQEPQRTQFRSWPRTTVPAAPPSCLLVYSTDPKVTQYAAPGTMFGIDFFHEPM